MPEGRRSVVEVAGAFLRLGFTAFGGPAAHLAMMEEEFVRRRAWLTSEEFVDLIGAASLVPGPNSTEVAIHLGLRRAGIAGMVVAGLCFILPAAFMVSALAWGYVRYGSLPDVQSALYGIKPVVVAVVGQAVWLLVGKTTDSWPKRLVLGGSVLAAFLGAPELAVLLGAGLVLGARGASREKSARSLAPLGILLGSVAAVAAIPLVWEALRPISSSATPNGVFAYFLKLGSVLYGSGYVLVAFLERDLVSGYGWLTRSRLLDSVAVGQFTPGPVFTTATFVGYLVAGPWGAAAGTVGIFLPSFLFVAIGGRLLPRLRGSLASGGFLDGANAASLGLMGVVAARLAMDAIRDVPTAVLTATSLLLLVRWKVNSAGLILAGAFLGVILHTR